MTHFRHGIGEGRFKSALAAVSASRMFLRVRLMKSMSLGRGGRNSFGWVFTLFLPFGLLCCPFPRSVPSATRRTLRVEFIDGGFTHRTSDPERPLGCFHGFPRRGFPRSSHIEPFWVVSTNPKPPRSSRSRELLPPVKVYLLPKHSDGLSTADIAREGQSVDQVLIHVSRITHLSRGPFTPGWLDFILGGIF